MTTGLGFSISTIGKTTTLRRYPLIQYRNCQILFYDHFPLHKKLKLCVFFFHFFFNVTSHNIIICLGTINCRHFNFSEEYFFSIASYYSYFEFEKNFFFISIYQHGINLFQFSLYDLNHAFSIRIKSIYIVLKNERQKFNTIKNNKPITF